MALHGLRWFAGAAVVALAVVGACGYPDFTYGSGAGGATSSSSSGVSHGGGGATTQLTSTGGATSTGRTTSTSASTGGGGAGGKPEHMVTCFDASQHCPASQICCFDRADNQRDCDECAPPEDDCGADLTDCDPPQSYVRLTCDEDADCADQGQVCCVKFDAGGDVVGISCANFCDTSNNVFPVCGKQACTSGSCNDLNYAGYGFCM